MPTLPYIFPINATRAEVFRAIATSAGLESWWAKTAAGEPVEGDEYQLGFGPEYSWRATCTRCVPDSEFELLMTKADSDWQDSRLVFRLTEKDGKTEVDFKHLGWPTDNEHFRISCYCWAMYLRLLRRYVEFGEVVPYENRLDV